MRNVEFASGKSSPSRRSLPTGPGKKERRTEHSTSIGGMGGRDLDDIYEFAQHMKDTNNDTCMLHDFIAKQACNDDKEDFLQKKSPIKSIEVLQYRTSNSIPKKVPATMLQLFLLSTILLLMLVGTTALRSYPLISHRQQLERRQLSAQDAALFQGMGTHYVDLYVGTPQGQIQTLIVDTGSEWTAFPCVKGCCGKHTDSEFNRDQSETYKTRSCSEGCYHSCSSSTCEVSAYYAEGSGWTAIEAVDQVSLSGNMDDAFPLRFGCQTKTTKLFLTQLADGIMGMDDDVLSLWRQAGVDSFSLCFSSSYHLKDAAGVLTLGGSDPRLFPGAEIQWAKRLSHGTFYYVHLNNISLKSADGTKTTAMEGFNPIAVNTRGGGVLLDSGTTDTYFPTVFRSVFQKAFQQFTGRTWSFELSLTLEEAQTLPTLVLELEGFFSGDVVTLEVVPLQYLEASERIKGRFVPALFFEGSETVLGANFLQGHNFHFANDKIGVVASSCNYQDVAEEIKEDEVQPIKEEDEQKDVADGGQNSNLDEETEQTNDVDGEDNFEEDQTNDEEVEAEQPSNDVQLNENGDDQPSNDDEEDQGEDYVDEYPSTDDEAGQVDPSTDDEADQGDDVQVEYGSNYDEEQNQIDDDGGQSYISKEEMQGSDSGKGGISGRILLGVLVVAGAIFVAKKRAERRKQRVIQYEAARAEIQLT